LFSKYLRKRQLLEYFPSIVSEKWTLLTEVTGQQIEKHGQILTQIFFIDIDYSSFYSGGGKGEKGLRQIEDGSV